MVSINSVRSTCVDTAFLEDSSQTGIGMIIHYESADFGSCRTLLIHDFIFDEGEALGLHELAHSCSS